MNDKDQMPHRNKAQTPKWKTAAFVGSTMWLYLAFVAYTTLTGTPRPPHSISPDCQERGCAGKWVDHGSWQLQGNIRSRKEHPVHMFNQSPDTLSPFSVESEKPSFVMVLPSLIFRCEKGLFSAAFGIDNRSHPVEWWPNLPISWTIGTGTESDSWILEATRDGGGIWYSPQPHAFMQSISHAENITVEITPPNETRVSVGFDLNGTEDIVEIVQRRCPNSLSN